MVHVENKNCPINRRRERSSCEIHHVSHVEISSFQRNFVEHNFLHHQFPDMEKDGCRLNMHIQPTFGDLHHDKVVINTDFDIGLDNPPFGVS